MTPTMTTPIKNDALEKKKRKQRIVETATEQNYYVCGKRTNKNVWELQQLYETTQAKTTKLLPEFMERIRFMVLTGIRKASYSKSIDQNGEMFNYVLYNLFRKIIPTKDPNTGELVTIYKPTKTNLGAYILNSCYWSVLQYQNGEKWHESLLSCSDFMEDYEKASTEPLEFETDDLKFISRYDETANYVPIVQQIVKGASNDGD